MRWANIAINSGKWMALLLLVLHFLAFPVFAGEGSGAWRPTFDLIMRWLNFFILAGILIKFGRVPIMNFLRGQKEQYESEIHRFEKEKEKAVEKIRETQQMLEDSNQRLGALKGKIVQQGIKKKQDIIESARRESRLMIEDAKRKAAGRVVQAGAQFKMELVDEAMGLAEKRLVEIITAEDNQKIIARYMHSIEV